MISIGLLYGCDYVDNQFKDITHTNNHEDTFRENVASIVSFATSYRLAMNRVHIERTINDGCIYRRDEGGSVLIGINESKFSKNRRPIKGSKLNAWFAQAVIYCILLCKSKQPEVDGNLSQIKFFWLTSNVQSHIVLVSENQELLKAIYEWHDSLGEVTPCEVWGYPGIREIFEQHPLKIHRSFDMDDDFKITEFIKCTLDVIGVPATLFDGNTN